MQSDKVAIMQLAELKKWFAKKELPKTLQLNEWTFLVDVKKCVESNISYLEANKKKKGFLPYYNQLVEIKEKLEQKIKSK